jgi:hypothetical protein
MRDDKTGWEIIWDGTPRGVWGSELLPPRDQLPSPVWSTTSKRKYTRTGRYSQRPILEGRTDDTEGI